MPVRLYEKLGNDAGVLLHPVRIQELVASEGGSWNSSTAMVAAARLSRSEGAPVVMHRRKLNQFRSRSEDWGPQDRVVIIDLDSALRRCVVCDAYYVDEAERLGVAMCVDCLIDQQATDGF